MEGEGNSPQRAQRGYIPDSHQPHRRYTRPLRNSRFFLLSPLPIAQQELLSYTFLMGTSPQAPSARHAIQLSKTERLPSSAMRHFEKKGCRFFKEGKFLKPSHSTNVREFRPMPTTSRAMRHFEKNDKRGAKDYQTFSFSQTVSLPPKTESGRAAVTPRLVTPSPPVLGEGWGEGKLLPLSA